MHINNLPYQRKAIDGVLSAWKTHNKVFGVSAPRSGKTIIALKSIAEAYQPGQRALFLVHLTHLNTQTYRTINKFDDFKNLRNVGIVAGSMNQVDKSLTIAMSQTLNQPGRLAAVLAAGPIDYLIVDEAHWSPTAGFTFVINTILKHNPNCRVLGISATPIRKDGIPLRRIYDAVAFNLTVWELIQAGALVDVKYFPFEGVEDRITKANNLLNIVFSEWLRLASDRITVGFVRTIREAKEFAQYWTEMGFPATVIYSGTSMKEEKLITEQLMAGEYRAVFNAGKLTEGWDAGAVSCVLMVRAADSPVLFPQAATRGLGAYGNKKNCYILDFRPTPRRTLATPRNILGDTVGPEVIYVDVENPLDAPTEKIVEEPEGPTVTAVATTAHCIVTEVVEPFEKPQRITRAAPKRLKTGLLDKMPMATYNRVLRAQAIDR